jgi:heme/copper-type cytochrome/quinol oxidase subunit 2
MPVSIADAIFWVAVACCTVAQLAILRSIIISPVQVASSGAPASGWRRASEIAWAVIPGIALIFVFIATWNAIHGHAGLWL